MSRPVPRSVLIAAEHPVEAMELDGLFRTAGCPDVRITSDGREIIPLRAKWSFELLVLDMGLNTQSSLNVLKQLAEPIQHHQLAVLALTNAGDGVTQEQALKLGAGDVFTRPFTRAETLMRVSSALASLNGAR